MIPQGFASPNPKQNASINQGKSLQQKLAKLGVNVSNFFVNTISAETAPYLSITDAEAAGVGPDDLINLVFLMPGQSAAQGYYSVADVAALFVDSAAVASIYNFFKYVNDPYATNSTLNAIANMPEVDTVVKAYLS